MKVALTGGTGFLGRAVAARLIEAGHAVVLPARGRDHALPAGAEFVPITAIEALSVQDWRGILRGTDAVIHAAAIAHIGRDVPAERYLAVNRDASARLAEAAAAESVGRFAFVSSIRAQVGPTSDLPQSEASPPRPTEPYGESKLQAERLISAAFPAATHLRPPLIIGDQPKGNLAILARLAASPLPLPFGGFDAPQAVVGRDNLADALLLALTQPSMRGETYVIADDPHPTIADMLRWMREGMGRPAWIVPVPPAILRLPAALLGKAAAFDRLTGGLAVDASKLVAAGWGPRRHPADAFRALGAAWAGRSGKLA
ncbi:MAG: NAD-dependent epimerase/dehydratase family protein [Beijerinckiaceae bacterium]